MMSLEEPPEENFLKKNDTSKKYEHVRIPVTIETLKKLDVNSELVTFGKYNFHSFRVMAIIKGVSRDARNTDVIYHIRNVGAAAKDEVEYIADQTAGYQKFLFTPGTTVQIAGNLISAEQCQKIFTDVQSPSLHISHIREITNPNEIDIFVKEARIAELYFSKDIPSLIQKNEMAQFNGTLLACTLTPSNLPIQKDAKKEANTLNDSTLEKEDDEPRISHDPSETAVMRLEIQRKKSEHHPKNNSLQQNLMIDYFLENQEESEGLTLAEVKSAINGDNFFFIEARTLINQGILAETVVPGRYVVDRN